MPQVRPFQPADVDAVQMLLQQLGYDVPISDVGARIECVLAADGHHAVVAEQEGRVVGLVHVFARPALEKTCDAVVQTLVVDAKVRGLGIGKLLMAEAEDWACTRGLVSIALHTRIDRFDACRFYEQIGYRRITTSHLMRKELAR